MISLLLYSRDSEIMTKVLSDQLVELGYLTEQTTVLNLPRLILNPFQILHLIVDHLPLTFKEILYMTAAKNLGKSVVLSVLNANKKDSGTLQNQVIKWIHIDALTVGQTDYLKNFRHENCIKMILPSLLEFSDISKDKLTEPIGGFLFPLLQSLDEAIDLNSPRPVYFDGRNLLKSHSSSALRKKWANLLTEHKIKSHYHLILSEEKINQLITSESLGMIVASPEMLHTDFTQWLNISLRRRHLIILNQFQATGFSNHWTSGQNCLVISSHHWLKELNQQMANSLFQRPFSISSINKTSMDALFNDLSRLYTKIVYQKTSLLDSDSAKI